MSKKPKTKELQHYYNMYINRIQQEHNSRIWTIEIPKDIFIRLFGKEAWDKDTNNPLELIPHLNREQFFEDLELLK